jgi:hypothetical protein
MMGGNMMAAGTRITCME